MGVVWAGVALVAYLLIYALAFAGGGSDRAVAAWPEDEGRRAE